MPEFLNVLPPEQALQVLLDRLTPQAIAAAERIPITKALGRTTSKAIHAQEHLPFFPRSTMDGYSVRAAETFGASEGLPAYFTVVGEVPMGRPAEVSEVLWPTRTAGSG